ncbi:MAG: CinA family protein [Xanthomonadales bacterium]|nr:CinA family protein [Xanthomonadales bacterium]
MAQHDDARLTDLARQLSAALVSHHLRLATAESCTGGWIAKILTDLPGSSDWYEGGWVTYSNGLKERLLGVRRETLDGYGAVSAETVAEMVSGALAHGDCDRSIAVSGIAGPSGGSPEKPVGLVWIGWGAREGEPEIERFDFAGDREAVRRAAVAAALRGMRDRLC